MCATSPRTTVLYAPNCGASAITVPTSVLACDVPLSAVTTAPLLQRTCPPASPRACGPATSCGPCGCARAATLCTCMPVRPSDWDVVQPMLFSDVFGGLLAANHVYPPHMITLPPFPMHAAVCGFGRRSTSACVGTSWRCTSRGRGSPAVQQGAAAPGSTSGSSRTHGAPCASASASQCVVDCATLLFASPGAPLYSL